MSSGTVVHSRCGANVFSIQLGPNGRPEAWCPSCRTMVDLDRECEIWAGHRIDDRHWKYERKVQ